MLEYTKVNVKLSDTQLKKLKNAVKSKTGTTLKIIYTWIIIDNKTTNKTKKCF